MEDSTNSFNLDFNSSNENFENMTSAPAMEFETVQEQPAKIKVIGVGGGGGNAVNHMFRQGIHGVDFIVCNTDAKALATSPVPHKIVLGTLGAGGVPERARDLALKHKDEIRDAISDDTQMLFITAGMGGGTGTGAAPVIAEIAKGIQLADEVVPNILVVAIVTMPFSFEGKRRREQAQAGIEELKKHVDAILVINNDKLRDLFGDLTFSKAFSQADDILLTAAKGIAEIITVSGYVNTDFRDVNTVMEKSGTALMGAGEGRGENRAHDAIESATTSVLLNDNDIRGAKNILLFFRYSNEHQITMDEIGEVTDYITNLIGNQDANIIWGNADDDSLNDELRITLIATGFEEKQNSGPNIINLETTQKEETANPTNAADNASTTTDETANEPAAEATIIHVTSDQTEIPAASNPTEKRIFVLDDIAEEESTENEVVDKVAEPIVEKPTGNSYLDEIRIKPRQVQTPVQHVEEPVATAVFDAPVAAATQNIQKPTATIEHVSQMPAEPTTIQKNSPVQQQIEKAFTPNSDINEQALMSKADRIRRMNELLHNNPNGPSMIEKMTTEELTGAPLYEPSHSAVNEAGRTVINSDGTMTTGFAFLTDLPD